MGTLVRFPLGGGANVLRLDRFVTSTGLPLDETLSAWRACGARVVDSRDRRGAA